jgi:TusA-related sulfurtransferase
VTDSERSQSAQPTAENASAPGWPEPSRHLDNRDLDPPEPMIRTLAAVEELRPGEVLCALLCREPVFLLPELGKRGHEWHGGFEADGTTYKLLVRSGSGKEAAA